MTAPRIPRHRAPYTPAQDRPAWYETTANRVIAILLLAACGGVALLSLLRWMAA